MFNPFRVPFILSYFPWVAPMVKLFNPFRINYKKTITANILIPNLFQKPTFQIFKFAQ
jgi:hypothetical protein